MSKGKEIINEFAKDIGCLDPIYEEISDINVFEILEIEEKEIRHSNFLAWLLDPNSSSGIGDKLLKRLLKFCWENKDKNDAKNDLDVVKIELIELDDVIVDREKVIKKTPKGKKDRRIDLLVSKRDDNKVKDEDSFCICIENKINSDEGWNQLTECHDYVEENFAKEPHKTTWKVKYENRYYIFLSPKGVDADDDEDKANWIALSYHAIYDWIKEIKETYEENIPIKAKTLIEDYLNALERYVIEGNFKQKCDRIYMKHPVAFAQFAEYEKKLRLGTLETEDSSTDEFKLYLKHKKAIDLVLANRTELSEKIKINLVDALEAHGQHIEDSQKAKVKIKVPEGVTDDNRLVDYNCENLCNDFLFFELYYFPKESKYDVMLMTQGKNCPEGFDIKDIYSSKELNGTLTTIGVKKADNKKISDYISECEENSITPSKDDEFIQALSKAVIDAMKGERCKKFFQAISEAI